MTTPRGTGRWAPRAPCASATVPTNSDGAVRAEIREGARIIKMFVTGGHGTTGPAERTEMSRDEMSAAIDAAHERGVKVRGHIANRQAIAMALDCGIDVIDHGDGMDDDCIKPHRPSLETVVAPSDVLPVPALPVASRSTLGFHRVAEGRSGRGDGLGAPGQRAPACGWSSATISGPSGSPTGSMAKSSASMWTWSGSRPWTSCGGPRCTAPS